MIKIPSAVRDLMTYMLHHDFVTNSKSGLHKMDFYTKIWYMRDKGFVAVDGKTDRNQKKWVLTDKGREVITLINKVEEVMKGEDYES